MQEWIIAHDLPTDWGLNSVRTFLDSMLLLYKLGIRLLKNGHQFGMVNDKYVTVVDSKLLVRRIPHLKKLGVDLTKLALYY